LIAYFSSKLSSRLRLFALVLALLLGFPLAVSVRPVSAATILQITPVNQLPDGGACGPASLVMALAYYGHSVALQDAEKSDPGDWAYIGDVASSLSTRTYNAVTGAV